MSKTGVISSQCHAVLRLVYANINLSQPQRVMELKRLGDPDLVISEYGGDIDKAEQALETASANWPFGSFSITSILDPDYPQLLSEVHEAPAVIFTQGELNPTEHGVSVVGSRNASPEQLHAAADTATVLSHANIPVISGLAQGIDTAAHKAALASGGRTIATMGTGLDRTSPKENSHLRDQIVQQGGLVLTQFAPFETVKKFNFPMRNAVMSGYGLATVVIAAEESSGTRHQVQAAVKHGRSVIFAGAVARDISWARDLVARDYGFVAESPDDVLKAVKEIMAYRESFLALF